ncbi:MAG TPA: hypothetical protein VIG72_07315 [Pontibacter sp.]
MKIVGRVFDNETGLPLADAMVNFQYLGYLLLPAKELPLADAMVNLLNGRDIEKTDSNGLFEVYSETRPFQDPTILVTKDGYKPFQLKIERNSNETSYTVTSESVSIDYTAPVYPDPENRETFVTGTWVNKWSTEFRTGDTLSIYLAREDIKAEVERNKKELENAR